MLLLPFYTTAYGQHAYRFNSELRTRDVYLFRGVGFEPTEMPPQFRLTIPSEYYIVMYSRAQIYCPRLNNSIPMLPSQFTDFRDVARLENKMLRC
jgi:hypothetical protein